MFVLFSRSISSYHLKVTVIDCKGQVYNWFAATNAILVTIDASIQDSLNKYIDERLSLLLTLSCFHTVWSVRLQMCRCWSVCES